MKKIQKKRKGFTLIELVVVIVIIAILAAVALLRFGAFTDTARQSRVKSEHAQLITAGNMWRAAQPQPDEAPSSLAQLLGYMEKSKDVLGLKADKTSDVHYFGTGEKANTLYSVVKAGGAEGAGAEILEYDFSATATIVD